MPEKRSVHKSLSANNEILNLSCIKIIIKLCDNEKLAFWKFAAFTFMNATRVASSNLRSETFPRLLFYPLKASSSC